MSHIPRGHTKDRLLLFASWQRDGQHMRPHNGDALYRTCLVKVPWLVEMKGNVSSNSHRRDDKVCFKWADGIFGSERARFCS